MRIERQETIHASKAKGNLIIYGRRKVGKTFLVKNYLSPDIYVLVKRGGGFYMEGASFSTLDSYEQFLQLIPSWMEDGKSVAIDEFQRLPQDFLDFLQTLSGDGRIILTGSSFHIIKEVISPRSPILGLFSDLKLSLISPLDIFRGLSEKMDDTLAFGLSPYLRDPWTIPYYGPDETELKDILRLSRGAIRSLIGEVFLEEEKKLSYVYEGIIRALCLRKWKLGEIADLLYSRKIIDKPDAHLIRPYFNNMEEMDLVRRIPIHGKKEFMYTVRSPVMELGFMLDERYNFFQQDISDKAMKKELANRVPHQIEQFCGEMFAQVYDGKFEYFYSKDFDIDFVITRGRKVLASGEVKWNDSPTKKDVDLLLERTKHLKGDRILFSK
ncbi:MAG: ATP-binding protein, partial [Thermoplasmata archaeon]|nr:ATP-binding protein [Thermoplasmata archaeon]